MSSSVLYQRLGELTETGLVRQDEPDRYLLTDHGEALGAAIQPIDEWAQGWAARR
jgi:DNA-binding HxlR family transcriptional regulator